MNVDKDGLEALTVAIFIAAGYSAEEGTRVKGRMSGSEPPDGNRRED